MPGAGNPIAWDRYAYTLNNPLRYIDPSGHGAYCGDDYDPGCLNDDENIDYHKLEIGFQYGVTLSDSGKDWDLTNAKLIYDSLRNYDIALNGQVKTLFGGAVLTRGEYVLDLKKCPKGNCTYDGLTSPTQFTIVFNTVGSANIPQMNVYHELGHLLDSVPELYDMFSDALTNASNRSFIGGNGKIVTAGLIDRYVDNDPNYASVNAIQASAGTDVEAWADIIANYVAGNINVHSPAGRDMYNFVTSFDLIGPIPALHPGGPH